MSREMRGMLADPPLNESSGIVCDAAESNQW